MNGMKRMEDEKVMMPAIEKGMKMETQRDAALNANVVQRSVLEEAEEKLLYEESVVIQDAANILGEPVGTDCLNPNRLTCRIRQALSDSPTPDYMAVVRAARELRKQHDLVGISAPISRLNDHGEAATFFEALTNLDKTT